MTLHAVKQPRRRVAPTDGMDEARPAAGKLIADERVLVMIQVVDLLAPPSCNDSLANLLGLSPTKVRLAQALVRSRTLLDLMTEFGGKMTTLRSQL